ncbi:hypothetical protein FACS189444_2380 [Spirochaetia bacterium]|nr:hypothetical protein FACS189444_2380 [Spirochaetia bacterium]
MKKVGGFCAVLVAIFFASMLFAACENGMMAGILGDKPTGEETGGDNTGGKKPEVGSVDTSYPVLMRNMFMGGSLLYVADSPSSGHLVPGAIVGVRLGKVNYDPVAGAEGAADPGPMFSENTDSTRYGYIAVETVDANGIRFQYTEYTADGKSSEVKGYHSLALGEEKDINGDGIPDISYKVPEFSRSGFEKAVTLNFLSSQEKLNTTMFAVLPEQYEDKEYPSGIIGINPEGIFIISKYTSTGARSLVRGIETGDLIIDGVNYKYQRAVSSAGTYRSARSVADDDAEDMEDSPDLYFPLMSVDYSYEIDDVDGPAISQSRAVAFIQSDYQKDQTRIRNAFSGYKQVGNQMSVSFGNLNGSLKLGVRGEHTSVWGTLEAKVKVVVFIDVDLTEGAVNVEREWSLIGGAKKLLNETIPVTIVKNIFWIEINPSITFDYLVEVTAACPIPLKGGFIGMYGGEMTVGANYGLVYLRTYVRGSAIKDSASYFELNRRPIDGFLTVKVGPSLRAGIGVSPSIGIDLWVARASAGISGRVDFTAKAPTIFSFTPTEVTMSKELNYGITSSADVNLKGHLFGVPFNESANIGSWPILPEQTVQIAPPVMIPILPQVATPAASPASGAVTSGTAITLSTATAGATIYYTTNGTTPNTASTQYSTPITVTTAQTIKAIAVKSGMSNSGVFSAAYTILPPVATPNASPASGAVTSGTTITLSTTTAGATIYYTTNGTNPTTASTQYSTPITVTTAQTIKAIAVKSGMSNSEVLTAAYTLLPPVATPTANPAAGAVISGTAITLSTTTTGATIYYTTDGTTLTTASAQYASPIPITAATTIKAIAIKSGMADSSVFSASYTILQPVAAPTANPAAGAVISGTAITLSTTTAGATIYYTTNGTTPTTASTPYSTPITVTTAQTIKAIAVKSGMADSSVFSAAYTIATGTAKVIYTWVNENDQIVTSGGSTTLSRGAGETLTISVTGIGYSDFQWSYNGSVVTGATTGSYTFNTAGKTNGIYNIGLQVKKGGGADAPWYSTLIAITVTN